MKKLKMIIPPIKYRSTKYKVGEVIPASIIGDRVEYILMTTDGQIRNYGNIYSPRWSDHEVNQIIILDGVRYYRENPIGTDGSSILVKVDDADALS